MPFHLASHQKEIFAFNVQTGMGEEQNTFYQISSRQKTRLFFSLYFYTSR